eukprot:GHVU01067494.1.p1 GENE.GHVU01067494.1~~GHVU01067494.1.p1  ORF type:complete len:409 (+),score=26.47 GHVU01067494.1:241-1467(+)
MRCHLRQALCSSFQRSSRRCQVTSLHQHIALLPHPLGPVGSRQPTALLPHPLGPVDSRQPTALLPHPPGPVDSSTRRPSPRRGRTQPARWWRRLPQPPTGCSIPNRRRREHSEVPRSVPPRQRRQRRGGAVTPTTGRPQRASRAGSGSAGRAPVGAVGGESGEGVSTTAAVQHPVGVAGGRRGRKRNKGGRAPTEATEQAVRRHEISPVEAFKTQALRKVGDQALEYTHTISQAAYALDVRHRRLATPPAATVEQTKAALKRVFDGGPYRTDVTPVPAHTFDEELEDYFSTDWGEEGVDLINMWWIDRRDRLPYLSAVARDVLGVNATSAACERVFSLARLFVTRLRCSMSDESVATCVLLHQWRKFLYGVEEEGPEGAQTARTEEETQTDLEEVSEYLQAWALRPGP